MTLGPRHRRVERGRVLLGRLGPAAELHEDVPREVAGGGRLGAPRDEHLCDD